MARSWRQIKKYIRETCIDNWDKIYKEKVAESTPLSISQYELFLVPFKHVKPIDFKLRSDLIYFLKNHAVKNTFYRIEQPVKKSIVPKLFKSFALVYSHSPAWFVSIDDKGNFIYVALMEDTLHGFRMMFVKFKGGLEVYFRYVSMHYRSTGKINEVRSSRFVNYKEAQEYVNRGCSHSVPHPCIQRMPLPEESDRFQCMHCKETGTYEKLESISCSYTPPPCLFCGQTPLCSPICGSILNVLQSKGNDNDNN